MDFPTAHQPIDCTPTDWLHTNQLTAHQPIDCTPTKLPNFDLLHTLLDCCTPSWIAAHPPGLLHTLPDCCTPSKAPSSLDTFWFICAFISERYLFFVNNKFYFCVMGRFTKMSLPSSPQVLSLNRPPIFKSTLEKRPFLVKKQNQTPPYIGQIGTKVTLEKRPLKKISPLEESPKSTIPIKTNRGIVFCIWSWKYF